MLIRNITRSVGIAAAVMCLYACTPKSQNNNSQQNDSIKVENCKQPDTINPPLTHNFLGLKVKYKSEEDSTKASRYLRKMIKMALPTGTRYEKTCDAFIKLEKEKRDLLEQGDSAAADIKEQQIKNLEPRIDSLWTEMTKQTIPSDSINQYAEESDLEPNTAYFYDWFIKEILQNYKKN